ALWRFAPNNPIMRHLVRFNLPATESKQRPIVGRKARLVRLRRQRAKASFMRRYRAMTADAKLSPKAVASLLPTEGPLIPEELQLATRNGGMPLEALRYDITPVGLHYQLIHFDIPDVDPATWRLRVDGLVEKPLDLSYDEIRAF